MADILGSIAGSTGNIFKTVGTFATVTFWGLVILGVAYVFLYFMKYKHPIYLFFQEGTGVRIKVDRGFKNKKKREFKALKNKEVDFQYPESKDEYTKGNRPLLCAYIKNQSATWLRIENNKNFIPADYDMQHKMIEDFQSTWNIVKPKEEFWDKYGQQILWIGSLGIFLVVIILILKRMDAIIALGRSVATAQAAAGKQVINSLPFMFWGYRKKNENN